MKLNCYDYDERTLRSHMSLIHGVYVGDVKTLEGLREAHDAGHADPDPHFQLSHAHLPETDDPELDDMPDTPQTWEW